MKFIAFALIFVVCTSFCTADDSSEILTDCLYGIVETLLVNLEKTLHGDPKTVLNELIGLFRELRIVLKKEDVVSARTILIEGAKTLDRLAPILPTKDLRGTFSTIVANQHKLLKEIPSGINDLTLNDIEVFFQFVAQSLIGGLMAYKNSLISGAVEVDLIGLLRELKTIVMPNARGIVQGLVGAIQDLQFSMDVKDEQAVNEILKKTFQLMDELLPKLMNRKNVYDTFRNILKGNIDLSRRLVLHEGSFDDVRTFLEYLTTCLENVLLE